MGNGIEEAVTAADVEEARAYVRRGMRGLVLGLEAVLGVVGGSGGAVAAGALGEGRVAAVALTSGAAAMVVGFPFILGISAIARRRGLKIGIENARQARVTQLEAVRREFETRLGRGLEMAEDEDAAFDVISRALASTVPDTTVELLLADNSHSHLGRMVSIVPEDGAVPGCPVDAPNRCVAARRSHPVVFPDSEDLDACPLLRGRDDCRCTSACVPVSIMGRAVGVVHAVRDVAQPFSDEEVQRLQSIANHSGNRLGVLRIMAESQLQAATDGLTGLMNRRSFENAVRRLRTEGIEHSLVMVDLDHFKDLNDTYGHEAGDRALRVFAQVVRDGLRAEDLACRYGGEEFLIVLPKTEVGEAIDAVERIRVALAAASGRGSTPHFTASFGIAHSSEAADLEDLVQRADRALFAAKEAGRDCVCIDGHPQPVAPLMAFG